MNLESTVKLKSGNKMPVLALGTWELTKNTADIVAEALTIGYTMIDTSRDYGTQPGIGEGIKKSGVGRNEFYLTTKVEEDDDAYEATKKDLAELDLEYADLMLIHRPPNQGSGEKLWEGLIRAKTEGLARDIGVSNYPVEKIEALIKDSGEIPAVNQIEWTPFGYDTEMFEYCQNMNIIIQAYSPLTRGERLDDETLVDIANMHGKTPAQVLIRWNLQLGIVPILKANSPDHLHDNIDVFDFKLSRNDMARLNDLNEEYSALGQKPAYMRS